MTAVINAENALTRDQCDSLDDTSHAVHFMISTPDGFLGTQNRIMLAALWENSALCMFVKCQQLSLSSPQRRIRDDLFPLLFNEFFRLNEVSFLIY